MLFQNLGRKVLMGGKKMGQKVIAGGKWFGNKIWENKGKLLMAGTALAGLHGIDVALENPAVQEARSGLAHIPMEAVGQREGFKEQVKDVVFRQPLQKAADRAKALAQKGAEKGMDIATDILFYGVPKRHSAELKILDRAGLDPSGKPKRPEPSWD